MKGYHEIILKNYLRKNRQWYGTLLNDILKEKLDGEMKNDLCDF